MPQSGCSSNPYASPAPRRSVTADQPILRLCALEQHKSHPQSNYRQKNLRRIIRSRLRLFQKHCRILARLLATMPMPTRPRMHARSPTFPLYHSTRKKPRRWPLVLRFIKGAIHVDIAMPVVLHAAWTALIVYLDQVREDHIGLPSSIIPSLSIVVGLMLVFRNSTSYDRFWQARMRFLDPLIYANSSHRATST